MSKNLSITAYAKHRGCSRQAVYDALDAGRIVREPDKKLDAEKADRMWAERTDPGKGGKQPEAVNGDKPRQDSLPKPEKTLAACKKRLTRAIEIMPELAPFEGIINSQAEEYSEVLQEIQDNIPPWDTPWTVSSAHLLLSGIFTDYLRDSGQVSAEVEDLAGSVLCNPGWPECEEEPYWKVLLTRILQKRGA